MTVVSGGSGRFAHQGKQENDANEQNLEQQKDVGNGQGHGLTATRSAKTLWSTVPFGFSWMG